GDRIRRLLSEEEPALANFDGDRVARERRYQDRDLSEGLAAFAAARRRNLETLRGVSRADWKRQGLLEDVGRITLSDIPRKMAEHDRSHTQDIASLLCEQNGEPKAERGDHQTSAVA
ncbi:MAG: DinB family protein, partial [Thermoanaerobaculia bacterium]